MFTSQDSKETPQKTFKQRVIVAALVLMLGTLVSCGPNNQSATDNAGSATAGDVEPGPSGEPVLEENDLDDDSLMKDESPNERQTSPTAPE